MTQNTAASSNIRLNRLGSTTAEDDQAMLSDAFVPTADFRSLVESEERTVVVGRRGTGKSALFLQLQKHWDLDKKVTVLSFAPEDIEVIGFRSALKPFAESFALARASTRLLWRYAMLMEVASALKRNYKATKLIEGDELLLSHIASWSSESGSLLKKCRHLAKKFLSAESPEEAVGDLSDNLNLKTVEERVFALLERSDRRIVLLMDRLDEGYEPDSIGIGIITGLVYASIELNKKAARIRPVIFLRDNIFRAVAKEDPDYSRNVEGQTIRLHWDWAQLLLLAAARMRVAFKLKVEKDQRLWDRCTAGELQGREGFKKCLQFTLYRPRDLLSLLNEAFYCAAREGRETAIVSDLDYAARSISVARLEDLWKEYHRTFPSIQAASNAFANGDPGFDVNYAINVLEAVSKNLPDSSAQPVVQDFRLLEPSGIVQGLYSVGFLGIHDVHSSSFIFCHDGRTPDKNFQNNERLLIHPCYWLGLNLNKNALKADEAADITDEYGIKVLPAGAPPQSDSAMEFSRVRVAEAVEAMYTQILKTPYLIQPEVVADERLVSFRFGTGVSARSEVSRFMGLLGLSVRTANGVDIVCIQKEMEPDKEPFVYRPKYRDVTYLVELLRGLFPKGEFTSTRSVHGAPQAITADAATGQSKMPAPAGSAASLLDTDPDALVFNGTETDIKKLSSLLAQLDTRQGEVMVRGQVFEVASNGAEAAWTKA